MEIFGGESGVTQISNCHRFRTGQVFDIVTGTHLTDEKEQKISLEYIMEHKPLVAVAGPSCTAQS